MDDELTFKPACGRCDERSRMLTRMVDGSLVRCPTCHPFWSYDPDTREMQAAAVGLEKQLAVIKQLRYRVPLLRLVPGERLRELTRQFFDSGWHAYDIIYALDHDPEGNLVALNKPAGVASSEQVAKWVLRRLETWRDGYQEPLPSRAQVAASVRDSARDRATGSGIDWEALARRAVPPVQSNGHSFALREVRIAKGLARDLRLEADRRELQRRRDQLAAWHDQGAQRQLALDRLTAFAEHLRRGHSTRLGNHGSVPDSSETHQRTPNHSGVLVLDVNDVDDREG